MERIQAEKQKLIKAGKRKKDKNPTTPIPPEELPFDIPDSWVWVRLGDVCEIARGGSPRPIKSFLTDDKNGINWIKIGDAEKGGKYINQTKERIIPEGVARSRMVHAGDFLLTNSMSFGRPYILNVDGCIHDGWLVISNYKQCYDKDFLFYLLSSEFAYLQFSQIVSGSVVKNLNSDKVATALIPLPPVAEQKRIVEKLETILPFVEDYAKAEKQLTALNANFPAMLKKSILQEAIQGKLVPQDPTDEPASLLLERIQNEKSRRHKAGKHKNNTPTTIFTRDNITYEKRDGKETDITDQLPFQIPNSWQWVRLGEIASTSLGKTLDKAKNTGAQTQYLCSINVYWEGISLTKVKEAPFTEEDRLKYALQKGDLLICEGGDIGRCAIWDKDIPMCYQNALHRVRFYGQCLPTFYKYLIELYKGLGILDAMSKGVTIKHLVQSALKDLLIPLPPVAEQKRIVEKLEALRCAVEPLATLN